jgi:SAF domain-containing protein
MGKLRKTLLSARGLAEPIDGVLMPLWFYLSTALRITWYVIGMVVGLLLIASPVFVSWYLAPQIYNKSQYRLRWYVVAKTNIAKGTRLTEDNLQGRLGFLAAHTDDFIAVEKMAIGKYANTAIGKDKPLQAEHLSEFIPADVPVGGAVIPIEVKTEHAYNLQPGMQLAFVQDKVMFPASQDILASAKDTGFLLLSVTPSARDGAITTLTVQVPQNKMEAVATLATGQWRPVVLSALSQP